MTRTATSDGRGFLPSTVFRMAMNPIWTPEAVMTRAFEDTIRVALYEPDRIVHELDFHLRLMIHPHMAILLTSGSERSRAKPALEMGTGHHDVGHPA
jgi:hypothetical protein